MRGFPGKACAGLLIAVWAAGCVNTPPPQEPVKPPANAGVYRVGKPYQIAGVWYYPSEQPEYDETGIASWYGPGFYGNLTANGEMFTSQDLTAAHKTLPMPVNVRVTNLENGYSLIVRVNDRGPFAQGRIIDLSERAARLLGFYEKGTAKVRVQFIARADLPNGAPQPFGAGTPEDVQTAVARAPTAKVETATLPDIPGAREAAAGPVRELPKVTATPTIGTPDAGALPSGQVTRVPVPVTTQLYIQMGAFASYANAARLAARLGPAVKISPIQRGGQTLYRVRSGPYPSTDAADSALSSYLGQGAVDAHIVVDP